MEVFRKEGPDTDVSDEGAFRLIGKCDKIIGNLALHVDNAIGGRVNRLFEIMREVRERVKLGSLESSDNPLGLFLKGFANFYCIIR